MMIYFDESDFLVGIFILFALLPGLWWWKRNLSYLLFFSLFWLYLLVVVSVVVFPVAISTDYSVTAFKPSINLVPFYFGNCFILASLCLRSIIENVVLTLPFGFGI